MLKYFLWEKFIKKISIESFHLFLTYILINLKHIFLYTAKISERNRHAERK